MSNKNVKLQKAGTKEGQKKVIVYKKTNNIKPASIPASTQVLKSKQVCINPSIISDAITEVNTELKITGDSIENLIKIGNESARASADASATSSATASQNENEETMDTDSDETANSPIVNVSGLEMHDPDTYNAATAYALALWNKLTSPQGKGLSAAAILSLILNNPNIIISALPVAANMQYILPIAFGLLIKLAAESAIDENIRIMTSNIKNFYKETSATTSLAYELGKTMIGPMITLWDHVQSYFKTYTTRTQIADLTLTGEVLRNMAIKELIEQIEIGGTSLATDVKAKLGEDLMNMNKDPAKMYDNLSKIVSKYSTKHDDNEEKVKTVVNKIIADVNCVGGGHPIQSSSTQPTFQSSSSSLPPGSFGGKSRKRKSMRKTSKSGKKTRKSKKSNKRNTRK